MRPIGIKWLLLRNTLTRHRTVLLTAVPGDTTVARREAAVDGRTMSPDFVRTGELMDLRSYPQWIQDVVQECSPARRCVAEHELFLSMKSSALSARAMRSFLIGVWPVIEQFPQYMAMNLLKVQLGRAPGHDMARRYLIRNIRVEQNHAEHWVHWAQAHGVDRDDLLLGSSPVAAEALSHWCWHTCERDPLAAAMAATNYAIEGVTGEWAYLVCSSTAYELGFAPEIRKQAMKWLKVHAQYDDTHPWEALEIIATILGTDPRPCDIEGVRSRISKSYEYMCMTLDKCLASEDTRSQSASRVETEFGWQGRQIPVV
jgi:pyrroloquinoline quinone (PQQ) biosynthesis protein C